MATQNKKKSKLFDFFDFNRDNRPDALEEDTTPTLKRYFKVLGRRFWKLISLNVMMLPMIVPVLICFYLYFGIDQTPTANSLIFQQLYGANLINPSPESTFLLDLFGAQMNIPVYGVATYVGMGICIVFLAVTFGWQNIGVTYILRSMVRGEPVFLWSDYFYAIKRNLKPAFFLGLLDFAAIVLLGFDIMYFWNQTGSFWLDVGFYGICALIILYFFMRFYLYLMLVTFDLSIRKLLKNALIFTMLGIKRNLMAVLGVVCITAFNIVLFPLFAMTPFGIAIPLILPFLYYFAVTAFTCAYAAYPIIDRYMIAPYVNKNDEDDEEIAELPEETNES
ncbi:MAG: hypothetical protein IJW92_04440 [Clostridia bacterium]|nr:hypothetical protein [Clostridia bacterium]